MWRCKKSLHLHTAIDYIYNVNEKMVSLYTSESWYYMLNSLCDSALFNGVSLNTKELLYIAKNYNGLNLTEFNFTSFCNNVENSNEVKFNENGTLVLIEVKND